MNLHLRRAVTFVLLILVIGCNKDHDSTPNPPSPPPAPPPLIQKDRIYGWWKAIVWKHPNNYYDYIYRYFGRDSFYYEDNVGYIAGGSATGTWKWGPNDSLFLDIRTGFGSSGKVVVLQVNDTFKFQWGTIIGQYKKLDSPAISSAPISTIVGNGISGFGGDGGPALSAQLDYAFDVDKDGAGNLYIVENVGHRVRKVNASDDKINTIVGNLYSDFSGDGGLAVNAQLAYPTSIAIDASNNIYIVDGGNHIIRKINASNGIITTIAGTPKQYGFSGDGGPATSARLFNPFDLAIDTDNNLYVSDNGNKRIRKINLNTGIITTIAGNGISGYTGDGGPALNASINAMRMAVDGNDKLYFVDNLNHVLRKINLKTGVITTVAGKGSEGYNGENILASDALLGRPMGIAVDRSSNVYISEIPIIAFHRVRKISASDGKITTIAGNPGTTQSYNGDGPHATAYALGTPSSIYVDASYKLYIVDEGSNRIRLVPPQ